MEALLLSLTSKIDDISMELKTVKQDLANISKNCKTLRDEFSGFSGGEEASVGLAERTSTKQILEEILFEIKALKKIQAENATAIPSSAESNQNDATKCLEDEVVESLKLLELQQDRARAGSPGPAPEFPVVEIAFPQGEQQYWIDELTKLKKRLRVPARGITMTPDFSSLDCLKRGIVHVVISNYSTSELSEPRHNQGTGTNSNGSSQLSNLIPAQTKEVFSFGASHGPFYNAAVLCSYRINSTNMRLAVCCHLSHQYQGEPTGNKRGRTEYAYGVAFVPEITADNSTVPRAFASTDRLTKVEISTVKVPSYTFNGMYVPKPSPPGPRAIKYNNLAALATLTKHEEDRSLLIEVDFMDCIPTVNERRSARKSFPKRPIENGYTMFDVIYLEDVRRILKDKSGCVVEITNRLNVLLEDFDSYITKPVQCVLPPAVIPAFTREMFAASSDTSTEGMFLYCIGSTNLQIDAGFQVTPEGNSFAIRFSRRGSRKNSFTASFPKMAAWEAVPYIFADATEGEQELEYSNLRLTASMTCDDQAILRITISAF